MSRRLVATVALVTAVAASVASAQWVSVRCCVPWWSLEAFGVCLSGPGVEEVPAACSLPGSYVYCNVGCAVGRAEDRPTSELGSSIHIRTTCAEWLEDPQYSPCGTSHSTGVDFSAVFDVDGDGDLDLRDYASFQNELSAEFG